MKNIKSILKRDGSEVPYSSKKITEAILKAGLATKEFDDKEADRLSQLVEIEINERFNDHKKYVIGVEEIQDIVERVLFIENHFLTAKAYIIYRSEHRKQRQEKKIVIGIEDDLGLPLNSLKVLERRHMLHDDQGKPIESPSGLFKRVAHSLAIVEKKYGASKEEIKQFESDFYDVMTRMEFLPAGRTLHDAGTPNGQLANCFVVPIKDSLEEIFDSLKYMALIQKTGGGNGYNFSALRPRGDYIKGSRGYSSGPISFLKIFNAASNEIMQGGQQRGANMGILNIDHPDITEFITCKQTNADMSNFNISVGIKDKFMKAVEKDSNYDLINPKDNAVVKKVEARKIMDMIVQNAWRNGDPGLIMLDQINRYNPLIALGPIDSTNPCGEQPLGPFDACNLGSINLASFVKDKNINWDRFEFVVRTSTRMLDNGIDASTYPIAEVEETVRSNRRIGLGVMGWADMLLQLGIGYNTNQGVQMAQKVMKFINEIAHDESANLAKQKGEFPRWSISTMNTKVQKELKDQGVIGNDYQGLPDYLSGVKMRNVAITTIAPTGSISMIANCSSGIEPIFALSFIKNVVDDNGLFYINESFKKHLYEKGIYSEEILEEVSNNHGSANGLKSVSKEIRDVFVTAHDIAPEWHVKMQAAFQKHTDNAVSKTINFPHSATLADVENAYMLAWKLGCKGITVYRDGSKDFQILQTKKIDKSQETIDKESKMVQSRMKVEKLSDRMDKM